MRPYFKVLGAMFAAFTLSACANGAATSVAPINPEALIPSTLTSCQDAPAVPARPTTSTGKLMPRDDAATATYIGGLHDAYNDCKSTVAAVALRRHALDVQAGVAAPKKGGFSLSGMFASNPIKP